MKEISSKAIDWVRFPLVMLVLIVHCHPEKYAYAVPIGQLFGHSIGEMLFSIIAYIFAWVGMAAVPAFFMLSGYLFFQHSGGLWSWNFYRTKLKKRFHTLFIPYLFFNVIAAISALICGAPGWRNPETLPIIGYLWDSTTFCVGMHNSLGLDMQLYYPEVIPLWYVRDLLFMCIMSPLVWWCLKEAPKTTLTVLLLIFLSGLWIGANGYNSQALLFFTLGAYFSIYRENLMLWSYKRRWTFTVATLMLLPFVMLWGSLTEAQVLNHALYLTSAFSILGLAVWCTQKSKKTVAPVFPNSSFFIFALHMCTIGTFSVLAFIPDLLQKLVGVPDNFFSAMALFVLAPCAIAAFCMAIFLVMKKVCPRVLSFFTGGRC